MFNSKQYYSNPYSTLSLLAESGSISWNEELRAWIVLDHRLISELLKDENFSSKRNKLSQFTNEQSVQLSRLYEFYSHWLMFNDSPEHNVLRKLAVSLIRNGETLLSNDRILDYVSRLINDVIQLENNIDVPNMISKPISTWVFSKMFDLEVEELLKILDNSISTVSLLGERNPSFEACFQIQSQLEILLKDLDIKLSKLIKRTEFKTLTRDECSDVFLNVLLDGFKSLTSGIENVIYSILSRKEDLSQENRLDMEWIEELVGLAPPFQYISRIALNDCVIEELKIKTGDKLMLFISVANRVLVSNSDTKPQKDNSAQRRLSFGLGRHSCPGISLSKRIIYQVVKSLIPLIDDLHIERIDWVPSVGYRGVADFKLRVGEERINSDSLK